MIKLALNLPQYRLYFSLRPRRTLKIVKPLDKNGVTLYLRHLFGHKNLRRILGTNLALMFLATSFLPLRVNAANQEPDQMIIAPTETPLTTERVIQYPIYPVTVNQGYRLFHPALDLDGFLGQDIKPIKNGRVEAISHSKYTYGNAIIIDHDNNLSSLYAHLSTIKVTEGQEVNTNTVIGEVGSTGHSTGPHLHLEIRDHGQPINPYLILPR